MRVWKLSVFLMKEQLAKFTVIWWYLKNHNRWDGDRPLIWKISSKRVLLSMLKILTSSLSRDYDVITVGKYGFLGVTLKPYEIWQT